MEPLFIVAGAAALLAGVVASLLVPPVVNLAQFLRSFDRPGEGGERKAVLATAVPRLGGVAIAAGLGAAAASLAWLAVTFSSSARPNENTGRK